MNLLIRGAGFSLSGKLARYFFRESISGCSAAGMQGAGTCLPSFSIGLPRGLDRLRARAPRVHALKI